MTLQEVFDKSVAAVIAQGRKSLRDNGWSCSYYRGGDGAKCALGHLILDEYYDCDLEGAIITCDEVRAAVALSVGEVAQHYPFWNVLSRLQKAHDEAHSEAFVSSFKQGAKETAFAYGLQWNFE